MYWGQFLSVSLGIKIYRVSAMSNVWKSDQWIHIYVGYLATTVVMVIELPDWLLPSSTKVPMSSELLSVKKPGSFGWGNGAPSLPNMNTTDDIAGLSTGSFWTHNRATWMHLCTSNSTYEYSKHWSISSEHLLLFHSNHAWFSCKIIYL